MTFKKFSLTALCAAAFFPVAALADDAAALAWRCWYAGGGNLACLIERAPILTVPGTLPYTPSSHMPEIVRTLRTDPGALGARLLLIPLHTEPRDTAFVAQLAKLTVCGARTDCDVQLTSAPSPESLALR